MPHNRYQRLSEEEKTKKREYALNRYLNMSEKEKQKQREYKKHKIRGMYSKRITTTTRTYSTTNEENFRETEMLRE